LLTLALLWCAFSSTSNILTAFDILFSFRLSS
jgi:hypothetical protein